MGASFRRWTSHNCTYACAVIWRHVDCPIAQICVAIKLLRVFARDDFDGVRARKVSGFVLQAEVCRLITRSDLIVNCTYGIALIIQTSRRCLVHRIIWRDDR